MAGKQGVIIAIITCMIFSAETGHAINSQASLGNDLYIDFTTAVPLENNGESNRTLLQEGSGEYSFAASLGYKINSESALNNMRLETEFSWKSEEIENHDQSGRITTSGIMANAFYDLSDGEINPYIGFGAGLANISIEGINNSGTRSNENDLLPAYQAMAGVSYKSESYPSANMYLGYKYFTTIEEFLTQKNIEPQNNNLSSHKVEAGINVDF